VCPVVDLAASESSSRDGQGILTLSAKGEAMSTDGSQQIDYKTHILIGYVSNGTMTVICHWPYVPRQEEVHQRMDAVKESYTAFLLCTPTSIMRVENDAARKQRSSRRPGSR
jgi:hypothetical protein